MPRRVTGDSQPHSPRPRPRPTPEILRENFLADMIPLQDVSTIPLDSPLLQNPRSAPNACFKSYFFQ